MGGFLESSVGASGSLVLRERSWLPSLCILWGGVSCHSPSPWPYLALCAQVKADSKPSCRQATVASWRAKSSSHTVPHWPWCSTSRRPSSGLFAGPTSRSFLVPDDCGLLEGAWPSSSSRNIEKVTGGGHIMTSGAPGEGTDSDHHLHLSSQCVGRKRRGLFIKCCCWGFHGTLRRDAPA